ncbi:MAG: BON domain-containing protein [Ignavibacteriota bacterium]|nr:MAG: BON domain-containing protein [Chlorobiota bacterium]MBE7475917.1 BON domain-containing protein [Ignavibacteriales bacterium]MBL1123275.1 BON domain-containing protein [Ignavibacteriota bacterium]MCC7092780.1 BON domain-containing protein [Ignavibacteriaceae bacterium]NUM63300.1 BON domain-containing protein [Ignavibacteriaceae bacterium]
MNALRRLISIKSLLFLSTMLSLMVTNRGVSQIDTGKLVTDVENKIENYYTENFKISADKNGIVSISGEVNTLFDKLKIGELVSEVKGVKEIHNNIQVQNVITADDIIKANIENETKLNDAILEPEKIKIEVNNGVVTLSGTVSYFREKLMMQTIASWQDGVSDLIDHISVMSPSAAKSDANLTEIIIDLLNNNFPLEKNIMFDINNGSVNLYGTVNDLYAKNHIQEDIQRIIGVKNVVNEMKIINNS